MALIDRFLARAVKRGPLTVIHANGETRSFGVPDPAFRPVTLRFGPGVGRAILRDPSLGAAETFMDGRLTIEQGDILDLLTLMTGNNLWEDSTGNLLPGPLRRAVDGVAHRIGR
jgi:cyclopropane-fatty-acyl-phospholipid synthase